MDLENRIVSDYNEEIEYTFDDMDLDETDENIESDIHIIDIFGNPYIVAMGKFNVSEKDEMIGYFICYLLYEKKVVAKLGLYEISLSEKNIQEETINHRDFNFEEEKLILFDRYYEDVTKLEPYKYREEDDLPEKRFVILKPSNIKFEEDIEKQREYISKIQATFNDDEKRQSVEDKLSMYYTYLKTIGDVLEKTSDINKEIKNKLKYDFVKGAKKDGKAAILKEESKMFDNIVSSDIELSYYELYLIELLANSKIIVIENDTFNFNFEEYNSDDRKIQKLQTFKYYRAFDPDKIIFINKSTDQDGRTSFNILTYKDNILNNIDDLGEDLIKILFEKYNEKSEPDTDSRFIALKEKFSSVENIKNSPNEPDQDLGDEEVEEAEEAGEVEEAKEVEAGEAVEAVEAGEEVEEVEAVEEAEELEAGEAGEEVEEVEAGEEDPPQKSEDIQNKEKPKISLKTNNIPKIKGI